jgi:hypothetical protein
MRAAQGATALLRQIRLAARFPEKKTNSRVHNIDPRKTRGSNIPGQGQQLKVLERQG